MYTGVVETTGAVRSVSRGTDGGTVRIETATDDLAVGDSIGISGVCLTAVSVGDGWFEAELSAETADLSYLLDLEPGDAVNIERPLPADGRFDGHVVKGTIDTTARVAAVDEREDDWWLAVEIPDGYAQYVVEKGAAALDGISLTIDAVDDDAGTFGVAVVPETYHRTTLSETEAGDRLHFEADVMAKYANRRAAVAESAAGESASGGDGTSA